MNHPTTVKGRVAVVNRTNFKNYGSVLQCYALCEAIARLGYASEILWESGTVSKHYDIRWRKLFRTGLTLLTHPGLLKSTLAGYRTVRAKEIPEETIDFFDEFVKTHIRQRLLSAKELKKAAHSDEYARFVCGSDQVWCSTTTYVDPLMYLRFAPSDKRVAYAPSIGRDYIPSYNKRVMRKYINGIPSVSIRETKGRELIHELTGRTVPVVADPTLLFTATDWQALEADLETPERYLLCYFLTEPSEAVQTHIRHTAKREGAVIVNIGCPLGALESTTFVHAPTAGPREFLRYIAHADLVITDSYHGMLFSINYERNFYSVERLYGEFDQSSRQLTIIEKFGLQDRYVLPAALPEFSFGDIDYTSIRSALDAYRAESLDYLKAALRS